ncbi:PREDICTED: protocadherin Fat 3 [Condylura cristata]|uniref:protocadherin Fat 3 n=1 Tax=Condylura cristata TaxID=143302 RepID=UPI000642B49F|nr:PREDICTED: protocadherin Fat 3 [Condylura cristata]
MPVVQIQAEDPDPSSSGRLTYRITSGNPQNFFAINVKTGLISTTSRKLDREQQAEHFLEVTVTDGGPSPKQSTAWVSVRVLDENDNRPQFPEKVYQVRLPERDRRKRAEPVYRAFAFDRDEGPNAEVAYSIVDGNADGRFFIDPKTGLVSSRKQFAAGSYDILTPAARELFAVDASTGAVRTTAPLDRERAARFLFHVHVRDGGSPPLAAESPVEVSVEVTDVNDSPPAFTQAAFEATVLLPTYVGVEVLAVSATDPDSEASPALTYSLAEGGAGHFLLGAGSGVLTVSNSSLSEGRHALVVRASDGKFSSTAAVTVLVREAADSGLRFTQSLYAASVPEDSSDVTTVAVAHAVGGRPNEPLRYRLLNPGGKFRVGPTSGAVQTTGVPLDREEQEAYELVVEAGRELDQLRVARVVVRVRVEDANDNPPVFVGLPYHAAVQVDAAPGTLVYQVTAVDRDAGANGAVTYGLRDGHGHFQVDARSGAVTLTQAFSADLSSAEYSVTVLARDGGQPPLSASAELPVTVVNRAVPVFDRPLYTASVDEDVGPDTPVLGLNASSPEGQALVYVLVGGDPLGQFSVDFHTGVLTVARALDYEAAAAHRLTVEVLVHVHIADVNDNPPEFHQLLYEAHVSELAPRGHFVTRVQASDADSSDADRLEYSILSGDDRAGFLMDSRSGVLSLSGPRKQRLEPLYSLNVSVSDGLFAGTAQVHVRVRAANLHGPAFAQATYLAEVRENAAAGTTVARVRATDGDPGAYGQVSYAIVNDFARDRFLVDGGGQVVTTERLDRENPLEAEVGILLRALDGGGRAAFCTVRVLVLDENDNAPHRWALKDAVGTTQ